MPIPFNRPYRSLREGEYVAAALAGPDRSGDGPFMRQSERWLEKRLGCARALLVQSCTAALEMAALLIDIKPGDEVILPSYTFVSTANAFLLRGANLVFVDVDPDTLSLSPTAVSAAVTPRTRVIVVVHYGGAAADMGPLMEIAKRNDLVVIEDAAQALLGQWQGRPLGSIGHLGCLSFHDSKNVSCGEGGALLINDRSYEKQAEVIRDKGTNRRQFLDGLVDKYTWVALGSSYVCSEVTAALLLAQLEDADETTKRRRHIWERYNAGFEAAERLGWCRRPRFAPNGNGHLYYLILASREMRSRFISSMAEHGVNCVFHYVPLHSSSMGQRYARVDGSMTATDTAGECLVRLPLFRDLDDEAVDHVIAVAHASLEALSS